ncbi:MAG TPA: 4-hydroxy-tetrahydrodipicolinate reductase [Saprospirales bacterium]|nr:4-hydroxy-tetrahydrodipicolinate reductase [Saprospirales bacterium]
MKIGLLGYGKMGKAIDEIATARSIEVVWRIGSKELAALTPETIRQADVVIEFTRPEAAFKHVMLCLEAGVPVVSGTTGWQEQLPEAEAFCRQTNGSMLWASNFSVGVNLFFAVNQFLAQLMAKRPEYAASLTEIHHIHKLDAPSGTAITIANDVIAAADRYQSWQLLPAKCLPEQLPITALREGEVPGTHQILWQSAIDEISIEHKAHSRTGFASGALLAAEWLQHKRGVFRMSDVLGL